MRTDVPEDSDDPGLKSPRDELPREGESDESRSGKLRDVVSGERAPLVVVLDGNKGEEGRLEDEPDDGVRRVLDDDDELAGVPDGLLPLSMLPRVLFPLAVDPSAADPKALAPPAVPLGGDFDCDLSPGDWAALQAATPTTPTTATATSARRLFMFSSP
jgi:hypothetical protein